MVTSTSVFFYSAWPLGYHNPEARRKAERLAAEGYDVTYVAGVGTRNPSLSSLPKLVNRALSKVRLGNGARESFGSIRTAAVVVLPPRHLQTLARLNERWLHHQISKAVPQWNDGVAWIRWPTQELVRVVERARPRLLVYESVDSNHISPGITGRWVQTFEQAERRLVELADLVVVPSGALAARYQAWGSQPYVLPHGVDLGEWRAERRPTQRPTLGFVGTLDYKLDTTLIRDIARMRPSWTVRLIGPVQEGFPGAPLSDARNVKLEPPVPPGQVAALNATFDVGILPYKATEHYRFSAPLKGLELLAAGTPVVARPNAELAKLGDLIQFASTADDFVKVSEDVLSGESEEVATRRRAAGEARTWDRRLDEMVELLRNTLSTA